MEKSAYLKSPVSEKTERLGINMDMVVQPFSGRKMKRRLIHTSYRIGRDPACELHFNDPFLCPQHAVLRYLPERGCYEVEDLGSRNGVFLNGVQVQRALLPKEGSLRVGCTLLRWGGVDQGEEEKFLTDDPLFREAIQRLKTLARSELPILLLGETGTGKDVLARQIHKWSDRAKHNFVPLNGAALGGTLADSELFGHRKGAFTGADSAREGALLTAHKGTLFLDEVADLSLAAQLRMLRALEDGEVKAVGADRPVKSDFRLVSATSQSIDDKVAKDAFRTDFYHRIAGFIFHVPALRERPRDILAFARRWAADRHLQISQESEPRLLSYRWPGNLRELKLQVERAGVLAKAESSRVVLPHHFNFSRELPEPEKKERLCSLEEMEKAHIEYVLERCQWSRKATARKLGIARSTLFEKMKRYEMDVPVVE